MGLFLKKKTPQDWCKVISEFCRLISVWIIAKLNYLRFCLKKIKLLHDVVQIAATWVSVLPIFRESSASGSGGSSTRAAQRLPWCRVLPAFCTLPPRCCLEDVRSLNIWVKCKRKFCLNIIMLKKNNYVLVYLSLPWWTGLIFHRAIPKHTEVCASMRWFQNCTISKKKKAKNKSSG